MAVRPCISCRRLIEAGSYCPSCGWRRNTYYSDRLRGRKWQRIRTSILRAYNDQCAHCERVVPLEIHHMNGDPSDNRRENMIPLCVDCHREVERAKQR
jgi:5-methylcytosine-specific restriction endonuclease McrA